MHAAKYIHKVNDDWQCTLCPHNCVIKAGKSGICRVRKNNGQTIVSEVYNQISALHVDPIEKKPLYHFFPGKNILSIGSVGCNLRCKFCQNWEISQTNCEEYEHLSPVSADKIIDIATQKKDNIGIAFTYNEPTIWFEFLLEVGKQAKESNLMNVMVTNGFINKEPLSELLSVIDAFSVDLKSFKEDFYKVVTLSDLKPVKENIKTIAKSDSLLEITNLVVTGLNDDRESFTNMIKWIRDECGKNTVLHISRYFPRYKMDVEMTPERTMLNLFEIARKELNFVYLGNINIRNGQNTICPNCKNELINRLGYLTKTPGLTNNGHCSNCDEKIIEFI